MFVEDEQMGEVDDAEDKQQSETFGENDEKLVGLLLLFLLYYFSQCFSGV